MKFQTAGSHQLPAIFSHPHISGIGGIGTSGVALLLRDLSARITGSDLRRSEITGLLESRGINIAYPSSPESASSASCLIVPAGFPENHPEISAASSNNVPVLSRSAALSMICRTCVQRSILCFGTLSRAKCARITAEVSGFGFCAGASVQDGPPHARFAPSLVIDLDERAVIADPAMAADFPDPDIIISDWQNDALGYYTHDESPKNIIDIFKDRAHRIIFPDPGSPDSGRAVDMICLTRDSGIKNHRAYTFHIKDDGICTYLVPPEAFAADPVRVSGTRADISAAAAAWTWLRAADISETSPNDILCTGWFRRLAGMQYHDIRMHPVGVRESIRAAVRCAHGNPVTAVLRPFISTLHAYTPEQWRKALSEADDIVILIPPYEGCTEDDCRLFCRQLSESGCPVQCMSLRQAHQRFDTPNSAALWIGAPDILRSDE